MKGKVTHSSHLIDFLVLGFDYKRIEEPLENEIDLILKNYNLPELKDWTIKFFALYGNFNKIYVCRQARSQVEMKYKEIVIHIPIPKKSKFEWGVNDNQIVAIKTPSSKFCESLEPDFENFHNRYDFIIDCMHKGILHTFKRGFTVNNIKIKPLIN